MDPRRLYSKSLFLAALAVSTLSLAAQSVHLERVGGTLGNLLTIKVKGTSQNTWFFLIPSFNKGPTPLSFLDPSDPRRLGIGLDLAPFIFLASPCNSESPWTPPSWMGRSGCGPAWKRR